MNPVLFFFYHFFKLIVRASLWVFYRRTTVANRKGANIKGPVIVVANHPSTVLDPLNVAVHIPRIVHFLANASLFKTRFTNWFFNTFYCIPIERYADTGGRPLNNAASFTKATEFLTNGGILFIAPEGSSYVERRVRKLKTGLARIALNTEAANGFRLGLRILPAGLNYSDPTQFRSEVLTVFGEPIRVADFEEDWEADPIAAVRKLTEHVRSKLTELTTDTTSAEEEKLLGKLESFFQKTDPLPPLPAFERSQKILSKLKIWRADDGQKLEKADSLLSQLGAAREKGGSNRPFSEGLLLKWVMLIFSFPLFLLGWLIHFPPCFLTKKLSGVLNDDLHWVPTFKYCLGLIIYPTLLFLEIWAVSKLPGRWPTWVFVFSIVSLGLFAEWWLGEWRSVCEKTQTRNFAEQGKVKEELQNIFFPNP